MRASEIAAELGLAKATVSYHLRRLGGRATARPTSAGARSSRRSGAAACASSELCDLRVGDVRLHDRDGARFRIPDAKTEAGIREVQMSPDLVEEFVAHVDRLRRAGHPTGPRRLPVPERRAAAGSTRQRVGEIVREAAALATERPERARACRRCRDTTPHTLRRTYISIALLANSFDVLWVMGQVGHADSKMTMDVYAQLAAARQARARDAPSTSSSAGRASSSTAPQERPNGPTFGPRDRATSPDEPDVHDARRIGSEQRKGRDCRPSRVARPGLEPGTPRFSVVCSTN